MTPGEHIAEAERLLALTHDSNDPFYMGSNGLYAQLATGHALIAIAVELGAPHAPAAPGGEQGVTQAPPG